VVETGAVEPVIKESRHPYTQLLVSSIPLPDPDHRWGQDMVEADEEEQENASRDRCLFAPRCPHVMPICRQAAPPMYWPRPHQASACYLETEERAGPAPAVLEGDITQAFAPTATQQRQHAELLETTGQQQGR
jgi:peptide/nickel transport system ATP-binding protein